MIKNKKHWLSYIFLCWCIVGMIIPLILQAQDTQNQDNNTFSVDKSGVVETSKEAGLPTGGNLPTIIGQIVGWLLGILGAVFLVIIIIGGFLWMTSGGNEDKVRQAKRMIIAAFLGLLMVFLSYSIAFMIGDVLLRIFP